MRYFGSLLFTFCLCLTTVAQNHSNHKATKPATLMSGISNLHHPVTTSNPDAQKFFDQGLRLIYAFNHDEAARSFQRAADLDPKMAWRIGASRRRSAPTTTTRLAMKDSS